MSLLLNRFSVEANVPAAILLPTLMSDGEVCRRSTCPGRDPSILARLSLWGDGAIAKLAY